MTNKKQGTSEEVEKMVAGATLSIFVQSLNELMPMVFDDPSKVKAKYYYKGFFLHVKELLLELVDERKEKEYSEFTSSQVDMLIESIERAILENVDFEIYSMEMLRKNLSKLEEKLGAPDMREPKEEK